jgi:hypothetical protein
MYKHKVNIPYYNVYTSFWDILRKDFQNMILVKCSFRG